MCTKLSSVLRQEISELETALANDPRFVKLTAARALLVLYEQQSVSSVNNTAKSTFRPVSEARERALKIAEDMIVGRTQPTPTREIVSFVKEQGVEIPGKDPVSNMSAMLSQSDRFKPNGRAGWTLVSNVKHTAVMTDTQSASSEAPVVAENQSDDKITSQPGQEPPAFDSVTPNQPQMPPPMPPFPRSQT